MFLFTFWCAGSSLRHMSFSVVVAHGLCCPTACGILVPYQPRIEPCSARWILSHWILVPYQPRIEPCGARWILSHWTTREVPQRAFLSLCRSPTTVMENNDFKYHFLGQVVPTTNVLLDRLHTWFPLYAFPAFMVHIYYCPGGVCPSRFPEKVNLTASTSRCLIKEVEKGFSCTANY